MRYDAVIFDLFGTLVDELSFPESQAKKYWQMMAEVQRVLEVEGDDFFRLWRKTSDMRMTGFYPSLEAALTYLCAESGQPSPEDQIVRAAELRRDFIRRHMIPRHDSVSTITQLKAQGYKIGLISDCTIEVAEHWPNTDLAPLFDATVLSCEVGLKKPDPKIFELACEKLGVEASNCLYIGDGNSRELTGASKAGMTPVLIRATYDDQAGGREDGNGARISSASEVLALLG